MIAIYWQPIWPPMPPSTACLPTCRLQPTRTAWPVYDAQVQALSSDGRCKAFAADADGYGRGEGFASVVIEAYGASASPGAGRSHPRHGAAVAVLAGSAVNQDGRSSGLTAPHGPSQVGHTHTLPPACTHDL